MCRFNAEDPGQSLYTPTTVGVMKLGGGLQLGNVDSYGVDLSRLTIITQEKGHEQN